MRITFLGTAAARPTVGRNVSALTVQREGELLMFDCGEGTQRQMMRYGTGFSLHDVFFSHLHADHFLGIIGLLRTLGLQGREEEMRLWTPRGTESLLRQAVELGVERVGFEVRITGLEPGEEVARGEYAIVPFRSTHGARCLGYAIRERPRLGRFDPARARELGVPEGPLWGKLHHGQPVEVEGRIVEPAEVVGRERPGRLLVYTGDTRPSRYTVEAASEADLLIHEATFALDEAERAAATGHSTARDAASVARDAGVRRLVLTHFSPRYADDPRTLEREARAVFSDVTAAYDGLVIEVPYAEGTG
jgi:ribonuclease Z